MFTRSRAATWPRRPRSRPKSSRPSTSRRETVGVATRSAYDLPPPSSEGKRSVASSSAMCAERRQRASELVRHGGDEVRLEPRHAELARDAAPDEVPPGQDEPATLTSTERAARHRGDLSRGAEADAKTCRVQGKPVATAARVALALAGGRSPATRRPSEIGEGPGKPLRHGGRNGSAERLGTEDDGGEVARRLQRAPPHKGRGSADSHEAPSTGRFSLMCPQPTERIRVRERIRIDTRVRTQPTPNFPCVVGVLRPCDRQPSLREVVAQPAGLLAKTDRRPAVAQTPTRVRHGRPAGPASRRHRCRRAQRAGRRSPGPPATHVAFVRRAQDGRGRCPKGNFFARGQRAICLCGCPEVVVQKLESLGPREGIARGRRGMHTYRVVRHAARRGDGKAPGVG